MKITDESAHAIREIANYLNVQGRGDVAINFLEYFAEKYPELNEVKQKIYIDFCHHTEEMRDERKGGGGCGCAFIIAVIFAIFIIGTVLTLVFTNAI